MEEEKKPLDLYVIFAAKELQNKQFKPAYVVIPESEKVGYENGNFGMLLNRMLENENPSWDDGQKNQFQQIKEYEHRVKTDPKRCACLDFVCLDKDKKTPMHKLENGNLTGRITMGVNDAIAPYVLRDLTTAKNVTYEAIQMVIAFNPF
jgi:hypothetical protein